MVRIHQEALGDTMTTKETIRAWLKKAIHQDYKYAIIYCDAFDYSDYPVYIKDAEDYFSCRPTNQDTLMEIYDLSLDIEMQLDERRAYHPPVKEK